jgi:hypothetical protein
MYYGSETEMIQQQEQVSKRVNLTLPDVVYDELEAWAEWQGRPTANLAAYLVEAAIREAKEKGEFKTLPKHPAASYPLPAPLPTPVPTDATPYPLPAPLPKPVPADATPHPLPAPLPQPEVTKKRRQARHRQPKGER